MRGYRLLLRCYPRSFRHEYGEEMYRLFDERRRRATPAGRAALWAEALGDAVGTAPRVHLDILRQDLRYARRALSQSRSFAVTAILVTALGIGATTAAFSVCDRVLFPRLPYQDPERIVRIWEKIPGYPQMEPSPANYRDWRQSSGAFDRMGAHSSMPVSLVRQEPERVVLTEVTEDVFPILGVGAAHGRLFSPDEFKPGGRASVIISDALWQRVFGGDPAVIGVPVRIDAEMLPLDATSFVIVGVMPRGFYYPDRETELWTPARFPAAVFQDRDNNFLDVIARLKPGVSLAEARTQMDAVMANLERAYPKENADSRATVRLLADQVPGRSQLLVRVLAAAAVCVLLIACTNLASLLLTRFVARRREIAVRTALGAGRDRLIRQLTTESLVVTTLGGVAGVLIANIAVPLLSRLVPTSLPVPDASALEPRILIFAAVVTMATGMLFGVLPAVRAFRGTDAMALRDRQETPTHRDRVRSLLVVAQVASAIVLLVSAGLLTRALVRVESLDPGFSPANVLTLRTAPPPSRYPTTAARAQFYDRVRHAVAALPGVTAAAYVSGVPMAMRGGVWPVILPQLEAKGANLDEHRAIVRFVTPDYFRALEIPLAAGRDIAESDTADARLVAVVSESLARRYWPNGDALGRTFTIAFFERTIVGIVADVRVRGLERISEPQVYLSYRQVPDGGLPFYAPKDLAIRTSGDPLAIAGAVRAIIRNIDPAMPVVDLRPMTAVVELETAARRTQIAVLMLFAGAAVLLAATGIHGLLMFSVGQRVREIGFRVALGATRGAVLRMILGDSLRLAAVGSVAGLLLAYYSGRAFETLLAGVPPADVPSFITAATVVVVMTLSGSAIPALRALAVDPATTLRG